MNPDLTPPLPNGAAVLALRDIVLPPRIGWWPPAPGWWILLLLLVATSAVGVWLWRKRRQRLRLLKPAQETLGQIERRFSRHGDSRLLLAELSTFLRQVVLSQSPREQVAGLVGDAWLQRLDQALDDRPFTTGVGRVFADQAYRPVVDINATELLNLCHRWVAAQTRTNHPSHGTG